VRAIFNLCKPQPWVEICDFIHIFHGQRNLIEVYDFSPTKVLNLSSDSQPHVYPTSSPILKIKSVTTGKSESSRSGLKYGSCEIASSVSTRQAFGANALAALSSKRLQECTRRCPHKPIEYILVPYPSISHWVSSYSTNPGTDRD